MAKPKRERRKKCRRKFVLSAEQSKRVDEELKSVWEVEAVHTILNRSFAAPCSSRQIEMLKDSVNVDGFSNALLCSYCVGTMREIDERCFLDFTQFAAKILKNFRVLRIGRIINDHVPSGERSSPTKLISSFVTSKQFNAIFGKLFDLLFPEEFLGKGNWFCLRRTFTQIFFKLRTRGEIATFAEVFQHIRLDEIIWLRNLPFKFKLNVTKRILNFLTNFVTNIICMTFYSTMNFSGQIVHYRRSVWRKIEKRGFAILRAQRMLEMIKADNLSSSKHSPIHRLRFLPKKTDVRPIVTFKNDQVTRELTEVRAILDLITGEKPAILGWGISNLRIFNFAYRRMILEKKWADKHRKSTKMFWCTMDLANCFTTINHSILQDILARLISATRKFTVVRVTVTNTKAKRRFQRRIAGNTYVHAMSRLRLRRDGEFIGTNPIADVLTGAEVLERIQHFVLRTVVSRSGQLFCSGRGIAQGNPLSVKLCNIYLGCMERMLFPQRPQQLFCRRYIDDYFFVSSDRSKLVETVKKIQVEGARFGVQLNAKKIVFSFHNKEIREAKHLKSNRKLPWCGFAFNTRTLCMTIDYQRYRHCRPRYTISTELHPSARFRFICATAKRLLKPRYMALRSCARVMSVSQRKSLRAGFCKFAYNYYFMHFIRQLRLSLKHRPVRIFFSQMVRWIGNSFRQRSLPDAADASACEI